MPAECRGTARPLFGTINDEIKSTTEAQIFQDARSCSKDSSGTDRGYLTAFEKFRFVDDISIKDLQSTLKKCDPNVAQTGVFDNATREGIAVAAARARLPK